MPTQLAQHLPVWQQLLAVLLKRSGVAIANMGIGKCPSAMRVLSCNCIMVDVIPTMWLTSVHMLYINVTRLAGLFRKGEMM